MNINHANNYGHNSMEELERLREEVDVPIYKLLEEVVKNFSTSSVSTDIEADSRKATIEILSMNYPNDKPRPLYIIAAEIILDWKNISVDAQSYIDAMFNIKDLESYYIADRGDNIVHLFLINAQTWKGDVATRIKKELNQMLKDFKHIKER